MTKRYLLKPTPRSLAEVSGSVPVTSDEETVKTLYRILVFPDRLSALSG
jgi:hypothetical protein